jgi:hypothetical protein
VSVCGAAEKEEAQKEAVLDFIKSLSLSSRTTLTLSSALTLECASKRSEQISKWPLIALQ